MFWKGCSMPGRLKIERAAASDPAHTTRASSSAGEPEQWSGQSLAASCQRLPKMQAEEREQQSSSLDQQNANEMSCDKFTAQCKPSGSQVAKFRISAQEGREKSCKKCFSKVAVRVSCKNLCDFDLAVQGAHLQLVARPCTTAASASTGNSTAVSSRGNRAPRRMQTKPREQSCAQRLLPIGTERCSA